jgi:hypothetical protein
LSTAVSSGLGALNDVKEAVSGKLGSVLKSDALTVVGKGVGAAAGVAAIEMNRSQAVENLAKGDYAGALRNVVTIANQTISVTQQSLEGAATVAASRAALQSIGQTASELAQVVKNSPITKVVGAAALINTGIAVGKLTQDFSKNDFAHNFNNVALVAANAMGVVPGVGFAVSGLATTALQDPDKFNTAVYAAGRWVKGAAQDLHGRAVAGAVNAAEGVLH